MAKQVSKKLLFETLISKGKSTRSGTYLDDVGDVLYYFFDLDQDTVHLSIKDKIKAEAKAFRKRVREYCDKHNRLYDFIIDKYKVGFASSLVFLTSLVVILLHAFVDIL